MAISHAAKNRLRRFCVWQKYLLPFAETVLVWALCALPLWRFSTGDGEIREYQSLFTLLRKIGDAVSATLEKSNAEPADLLLAKSLRPVPWVFWILMAAVTLSAVVLLCFAAAGLTKDPVSDACNRVKVKFRMLFPGKVWHFLLPVLTALPFCIPYYVLNRFSQYYAVQGNTETQTGGQTFTYYNYSLRVNGINPLLLAGIIAAVACILYFAVIPWERSQKMDMYRYYEKSPVPQAGPERRPRKPGN